MLQISNCLIYVGFRFQIVIKCIQNKNIVLVIRKL